MTDVIRRRGFLTGLAALGAAPGFAGAAADSGRRADVKVTKVENLQVTARSGRKVLYLKIHSDAGIAGLYGPIDNEAALFVDQFFRRPLIGQDPLAGETFWDRMFRAGVRAHYTASRLAAPLMISAGRGLIISTTFWDRDKYLSNLPYDLAKAAINRMAYGMALELREHQVAAIALSPGWMRTEEVLQGHGVGPEDLDFHVFEGHDRTESVYYIGQAVACLAADPHVMSKSGRTLTVGDLAREYGFADIDGRQPPAFRIPEERLRD